ncbi:MAG: phage tail protein, partial [Clostridia bacterium]|nr:phage tail protein [Clostridia bacterium]
MATGITYITTQGSILAAKTLEAKTLQFSKFVIGDGQLADTSASTIKELTGLVNSVLNFDITKISRDTETQVTVRGLFQNTDADASFYLRELGLYAIDPDTKEEILFAYINYGN